MNKWKEIWEKKGDNFVLPESNVLESLFKVDGYDSKCSAMTLESWLFYTNSIIKNCNIDSNTTVYEVGCGSGAVLYEIQKVALKVGGIDYCKSFIENAKKVIKSDDLTVGEASDLAIKPNYDVILNGSSFIYFSSKEYTEIVMDKMLEKANRMIALFDINDEDKKEEAESIRRAAVGKDYDKLYKGLDHLYWTKEYFIQYATKKKLKCEIGPQPMLKYTNGHFRFSVYLTKI